MFATRNWCLKSRRCGWTELPRLNMLVSRPNNLPGYLQQQVAFEKQRRKKTGKKKTGEKKEFCKGCWSDFSLEAEWDLDSQLVAMMEER